MSDHLAKDDFEKRLSWSLLACRVVVFLIFAVWAYGTIRRPEMNADALYKVYFIEGMPSGVMIIFGLAQLAIAFAVLLGLYKMASRGILLALSALGVVAPTYVIGYVTSTIGGVPHPAILYYTSFCLFACCFMIFWLRDHDTLFIMKKWGAS